MTTAAAAQTRVWTRRFTWLYAAESIWFLALLALLFSQYLILLLEFGAILHLLALGVAIIQVKAFLRLIRGLRTDIDGAEATRMAFRSRKSAVGMGFVAAAYSLTALLSSPSYWVSDILSQMGLYYLCIYLGQLVCRRRIARG